MRPLPVLRPITPQALAWFDVRVGLPTGFRVLRAELGTWRALRVAASYAWRALLAPPLRSPGAGGDTRHRLTRQQLRPVLLLEAALRQDLALSAARAEDVLRKVVLTSGAAFLSRFMPIPAPWEWTAVDSLARERFVATLLPRMFNAEVTS